MNWTRQDRLCREIADAELEIECTEIDPTYNTAPYSQAEWVQCMNRKIQIGRELLKAYSDPSERVKE